MPFTDDDKQWLRSELSATENRLRSELTTIVNRLRSDLMEVIEATETKLLTAFHQWASPMDARMRSHAATLRALDLEQEALNDRIQKLEPPEPPS